MATSCILNNFHTRASLKDLYIKSIKVSRFNEATKNYKHRATEVNFEVGSKDSLVKTAITNLGATNAIEECLGYRVLHPSYYATIGVTNSTKETVCYPFRIIMAVAATSYCIPVVIKAGIHS